MTTFESTDWDFGNNLGKLKQSYGEVEENLNKKRDLLLAFFLQQ